MVDADLSGGSPAAGRRSTPRAAARRRAGRCARAGPARRPIPRARARAPRRARNVDVGDRELPGGNVGEQLEHRGRPGPRRRRPAQRAGRSPGRAPRALARAPPRRAPSRRARRRPSADVLAGCGSRARPRRRDRRCRSRGAAASSLPGSPRSGGRRRAPCALRLGGARGLRISDVDDDGDAVPLGDPLAQTSRRGHGAQPRSRGGPRRRGRSASRRTRAPSRRRRRGAQLVVREPVHLLDVREDGAPRAEARAISSASRVARLRRGGLQNSSGDRPLAGVRVVLEDADGQAREVERAEVGRRPPLRLVHRDQRALTVAPRKGRRGAFSASSGTGVMRVPPSSNGSPSDTIVEPDRALALHEAELVGEAVVRLEVAPRPARARRSAYGSRTGAATSGTRSCATPRRGGRPCGRGASASRGRPRSVSIASG